MYITEDVKYIGVDDRKLDIFEGIYQIPNGVSYNSYVIVDEKTAVMDTVEEGFAGEWLEKLKLYCEKAPDYLIIQHMEPDHSSSLKRFIEEYPETTIVSNQKAFNMTEQFFGEDICKNKLVIKDGESLSIGRHELRFIFAPMVHWPEVMVTYDCADKILFSADGFGKFGALDTDENWDDEARRYYIGIVGKYGPQVLNLLKKAGELDIEIICPLHGPVLKENLAHYTGLYEKWASYIPEDDGITIAYTSAHGNMKRAMEYFEQELKTENSCEVSLFDLSRCDIMEAVAQSFKHKKLVLAANTYNNDIFPAMKYFIDALMQRGFKNRTVALIENGSWGPVAAKLMKEKLEGAVNIEYTEPVITIRSAMSEKNKEELKELAANLTH